MRTCFLFLLVFTFPLIYASDYYKVNQGETKQIDEHGICKKVTNSCSLPVFVPTKTSSEWQSFINHHPGCVSLSECELKFYCNSCSDCSNKINQAYDAAKLYGQHTTVYLTTDISSSGTCISLSNKNYEGLVTFDGQGHTVQGPGSAPLDRGLYMENVSHLIVENISFKDQGYGIFLNNSSYNTFENITANENVVGILIYDSSTHNTFHQVNASYNDMHGISVYDGSDHTVLSDVVANNNGVSYDYSNILVYYSDGVSLINVTANNNQRTHGVLIYYSNGVALQAVTTNSNYKNGIYFYHSSGAYILNADSYSCGNNVAGSGYRDVFLYYSGVKCACSVGGRFHYNTSYNFSCSCHAGC